MAFATAAFLSLWASSRPEWSKRVRLAALAAAVLLALNIAFVTPGRRRYLALAVLLLVAAAAGLRGWCATSMLSSHFQTFAEGHLLAFFLAAMLARPVVGLDVPRAPG